MPRLPRLPRIAGIAACLLLSALVCRADEASRLLVTVNKKTAGKGVGRIVPGDEPNRVQTLAVSVTNQSVRALPAGVIQWTVVVRKYSGEMLKYSGKQDLPPLVSFKSTDVSCGSFDVAGRQISTATERDRVDYEVAIFHKGKETYRTVSVANFALLAEKAQLVVKEGGEGEAAGPKMVKNEELPPPKAATPEPAIIGAEKMPPQKPAAPVAEIAKPAAELPPVPQQTFDFFNLRGKTAK